ncbi:TPA: ParB/RepB/Spo0J family partition protein [Elizabethkingia anophelis]
MEQFKELKLSELIVSSSNPRSEFEQISLNELAESIIRHGVLQPIIVRIHPTTNKKYEIVCGERRFRASKIAGKKSIPVSIRDIDDDQVFEIQIIENLERKDVHPMDEAIAFKKMLDSGKYTIEDISAKVAKPLTFVSQRLKLNDLIVELKEDFIKGEFGVSHAILLARVNEEKQKEIFEDSKAQWSDGYGTIKELKRELDDENNNLDNAYFDISDNELYKEAGTCLSCLKCSKANSVLFPEYSDNLCFDIKCFKTKTILAKEFTINSIIRDKPDIIIVCRHPDNQTSPLISLCESIGKNVLSGWNSFMKIENDVEEGIEAYDISSMELVKIKLKSNVTEISISDPDYEINNNILKIQERADRALELDREKIYKNAIETIIENEENFPILFSTADLSLTEKVALCTILIGYDEENLLSNQFGLDRFEFRKDRFEIINKNFTDGMLAQIIRMFIKRELVSEAYSDYVKYEDPKIYMKILNEYFPIEIKTITENQSEIASKRIDRANSRINDLKETLEVRKKERDECKLSIIENKICKICKRSDEDFINEFGYPAVWNDDVCIPCSSNSNI